MDKFSAMACCPEYTFEIAVVVLLIIMVILDVP
jgi:hypothetical protein